MAVKKNRDLRGTSEISKPNVTRLYMNNEGKRDVKGGS